MNANQRASYGLIALLEQNARPFRIEQDTEFVVASDHRDTGLLGTLSAESAKLGLAICLLLCLAAATFAMFWPHALSDGDIGWHLAAGRYIAGHLSVPAFDPLSYTFRGQPWIAHEWLGELAMHASYSVMGWNGLALLFGAGLAATFVSLMLHFLRWMAPVTAAAVAILVFFNLLPAIVDRPHMLAWLPLTVWTIALLRARELDKPPAIGWALLMLVWANLHGSFVLGLFLAAAFGLDALVEAQQDKRWQVVKSWVPFGAAIALAALVNPNGLQELYFPFMVSDSKVIGLIDEWRPTDIATFSQFSGTLFLLLFACLYRPVRVPPVRILLLIVLLQLAFAHMRHQAVFALVGSLVLAEPLARAYRPNASLPQDNRPGKRTVIALSALALLTVAVRLAIPLERSDSKAWPMTALSHVPEEVRHRPVFNQYSFGGELEMEKIPAFIDGRADMFGDRFVQDYFDIAARGDVEKWQAAERKWHFGWAIVGPKLKITRLLDNRPDWEPIYRDEWAVVFVKQPPP